MRFTAPMLAIWLLGASAALAVPAVGDGDVAAFDALDHRMLQLGVDAAVSAKGALRADDSSAQCFSDLSESAQYGHASVDLVDAVLNVSKVVRGKNDAYRASRMTGFYLKSQIGILQINRRQINDVAGRCGGNAAVVSKASALLSLFDEAEALMNSVSTNIRSVK